MKREDGGHSDIWDRQFKVQSGQPRKRTVSPSLDPLPLPKSLLSQGLKLDPYFYILVGDRFRQYPFRTDLR